jgi:hypothetical protein
MKEPTMSTVQLFKDVVLTKDEDQKKLDASERELAVLAKNQEQIVEELSAAREKLKEAELGWKGLYNVGDHTQERKDFSNKIVDNEELICRLEEQLRVLKIKMRAPIKEIADLKNDIENSPLSQTKHKLFDLFDLYNLKADALAKCIKEIRLLEAQFRKQGGSYEFLSTFLGSGKPLGCWIAIPRLLPDRKGGEESCFLFTNGCGCDLHAAPLPKRR